MISLRMIELAPDGRISPADYDMIAPWWQARGGQAPSRETLPTLGVIVCWHAQAVATAFMYLDATGSGVAWLAWVAAKPGISAHRAGIAVRHAFRFLTAQAKEMNYWLVNATFHHPSLISLLGRMGFQPADVGMVQLFKPLIH